MCGIAGMFRFDNKQADNRVLRRMNDVMIHRGPDDSGIFCFNNIGLANRRLAIIDITSNGHQPMRTEDGLFWITFNGEIFNYKEIKRDLVKHRIRFETDSDTEVILKGYRFYGNNIVKKLRGQFAFCIWDKRNNSFILARDQMGINPLYYADLSNIFLFASEVKAIIASGIVKKQIDPEAIHHYLSFFMIPAPLSIIKGVKSLLPGQIMTVDKDGINVQQYWSLEKIVKDGQISNLKEAKNRLKEQLLRSVHEAQVSDVQVGAFLSGGIDSSAIVSLMAQKSKIPVKTFSLWAEEGSYYDERYYARLIAKKFNTDHTEFTISEKNVIDELPQIVYYFDQPTGGSFENYFVSKIASEKVKVVLSGLGGDELFAGYHNIVYKTKLLSAVYSKLPQVIRKTIIRLIDQMPFPPKIKKTINVSDRFLSLSSSLDRRLFTYLAYKEDEKKYLYSKNFLPLVDSFNTDDLIDNYLEKVKDRNVIDQLSFIDLNTYTRDDLLLGTNMMGMAHSVETRVPFFDPRLVKFSFNLHPNMKYRHGISKFILKDVVKDWLPQEIIEHRKTGFGTPREKFMRNGLKPYILKLLNAENVKKRAIFDPIYVKEILDRFYTDRSGKMLWNEHLRVWTLFILELWCRIYIDQDKIALPNMTLSDMVDL